MTTKEQHLLGERGVTAVRGEERHPALARWWRTERRHVVEVVGAWGTRRAEDDDAFGALVRVRRELEADGWLLAVAGARVDAHPSRMLREAGGLHTYLLRPAVPATESVGLFEPADPALAATADEQKDAYDLWWRSVGGAGVGRGTEFPEAGNELESLVHDYLRRETGIEPLLARLRGSALILLAPSAGSTELRTAPSPGGGSVLHAFTSVARLPTGWEHWQLRAVRQLVPVLAEHDLVVNPVSRPSLTLSGPVLARLLGTG